MSRKPTLSPTRISIYLECAVKYRYIYQEKLGRFYLKSRAGYSFGSTLHHTLQTFHEGGGTQTVDQMVASVQQKWVSAGYTSKEEEQNYQKEGVEIVTAYHSAAQHRIEAQVVTIATEKTITCDLGNFKLSGRIDRLDKHPDGSLEIIDYKSGRTEVTPEYVSQSLAMSCYQLILSKLHPQTPISATIYALRSGTSATYSLAGEALRQFEQDIMVLGEEILVRDLTELEPTRIAACDDCDFLKRCQIFWRRKAYLEQTQYSDGFWSED